MWRHYVYIHRKATTGTPFYVGKGKLDKRGNPSRASTQDDRSAPWRRTAAKHGFTNEILIWCISDEEACRQEAALIKELGRRDLGRGPLVNLTDGGDGLVGLIISSETRAKRSMNAKRPRSEAWIKSIRIARRGGGNGGVVKRGDKLPMAWATKIAAAKIGDKNPFFGKSSPPSKKVRNSITGMVYESIAKAAVAEGINAKMLYQYLDGARSNRSPLVRA